MMPIPEPGEKETKEEFVSRCIKTLSKADPNREQKQVVAICYSAWRESKKKKNEVITWVDELQDAYEVSNYDEIEKSKL